MRPASFVAIAAGAGLSAALACCSCDDASGPGPAGSGGSDAGDAKSEGDGGAPDAGPEDAGDAGDGEASVDADAWVSVPDAWELASWNPPGCQMLRAADLKKALPAMGWLDCGNGISGCTFLDTSQLPGAAALPGLKLYHAYDVRQTSAGTMFALVVVYGPAEHGAALFDLNGPLAAWRSNSVTDCVVNDLVFGDDELVALRHSRIADGGIIAAAVHGPRDAVIAGGGSTLLVDKSVTGNALSGLARVQLTKSIVALEVGVNPFVYTWDYSTAKPELIPRPPDVQEDYGVIVKGSEVVFLRDSGLATARAFAVRHADGTVENLFQKPSVWSAFLRSDGTSFCWQELSQSDAGSVLEVWKSPFTTVPAGFKAEKLASIPGAEVFVQAGLAGGYWVYRMNEQTLRAIRVSDGKHLDVQAPPGFGWIVPFGVVNGEIWAQIHVVPGTDGNPYSVARVPLASLGEPVP